MTASGARRAPVGTRDVLYPESSRWEAVVAGFAATVERAGYGLVISPMFEDVSVFSRGMGEKADVVAKEMYVFEDRGGRSLALRPEGTASIVRAFVQHRPPLPWKAWYATAAFRYERPQAGRFRQHHQLGVEVLGSADADLDVEVIDLAVTFLVSVGLDDFELRINSMGDPVCAPVYVETLRKYLESRLGELCDEHRQRALVSPLRVLDCKKEACRSATAGAPALLDVACAECKQHFGRVESGLRALAIPARVDARLVRGFDYYTRTTFELSSPGLDVAQNALGGGGRYDGLVEVLGGPATPGIGFGIGLERLLLACDAARRSAPSPVGASGRSAGPPPAVFVVDVAGGEAARDLTHALRAARIPSDRAFDERSLRSQMRMADRSGARLALIVGADEAAAGTVSVRALRREGDSAGGDDLQRVVGRSDVVGYVQEVLGS